MTDSVRARCWVCRTAGSSDRTTNFVCAPCAKPDHVSIVCANCARRDDFDPKEVASVFAEFGIDVEPHPGLIVLMDACPACVPKAEAFHHLYLSIAA